MVKPAILPVYVRFSGVCRTAEGDVVFSILTQGGNATTRQAINDITKAIFDGTF